MRKQPLNTDSFFSTTDVFFRKNQKFFDNFIPENDQIRRFLGGLFEALMTSL